MIVLSKKRWKCETYSLGMDWNQTEPVKKHTLGWFKHDPNLKKSFVS